MPETQGSDSLPGILAEIVETKRRELSALSDRAAEIERGAAAAPPARAFRAALAHAGTVSLIAECKRRSPGAGPIRPELDVVELTRGYERAGASALSVLTDTPYFGGSLDDLTTAKEATRIPVLRKDFTLDPLHLLEARAAGADAVLLIVRILSDDVLARLHRHALELGMAALVEVHDRSELERAMKLGAEIIGINNRDLATFSTDIATTITLLESVPDDVVIVSESGIRTRDDVLGLGAAGVDAVLVGESILAAPDPAEAARALADVPARSRTAA